MSSSLPTPGGSANTWGTQLNDYLQQSLGPDGKLVIAATNPYTGLANTNLASGTQPGLVQLSGDFGGTYSSPQVTVTHLISGLPVNQGGTGLQTIPANAVVLGNGTGNVQTVAAGNSGNVLTDNGTTWVSSAPTGGSAAVKQVEVDFGATPTDSLTYTVTDASVTTSSKIMAEVAYVAPTGKDLDEIEMDDIQVSCGNGSGTFNMFIRAADGSYLADKFKINYVVG